jgi:hypothetical protein
VAQAVNFLFFDMGAERGTAAFARDAITGGPDKI